MLERNSNIIFLRKTDNDIGEVIQQVQKILLHPLTQQMFLALTGQPLQLLSATKSEITTSAYSAPRGAAQLLGVGIGGSLTGKHADIIITDDIVNLQDRISKAERDRTRSIYQELQNIKNRGGRIINTGTPWHPEDAISMMPNVERYDCYETGLIGKDKLEALRNSMQPSLFAANYELRHIAQEGALFKEQPKRFDDASMLRDGIAHVDAAYNGEDYTAFTCGKRVGDNIYLYGKLKRAHVDTCIDSMLADCEQLMCAPIYAETNGDKGYLIKELRSRDMECRAYAEKMNKKIKISSYLRKWWPNIYFLDGTDEAYIRQILDYTDSAAHDDAPDSAACVCRLLDRQNADEEYI